jgi:hypothetical protein
VVQIRLSLLLPESFTLKVDVFLPADWTLLAFFHPPEDALRMEFMPTVEDELLSCHLDVRQTDGALELLVVGYWLLPVELPDRVYDVLVPSAG